MRYRVLVIAIALLALSRLDLAAANGTAVVQVTHDQDRDAETSIAINPLNTQNIVAGWISSGDLSCGYGVSFDGGRTWPVIGVIPGIQKGSGGAFDRGTDPSVVFDKFGNAQFTCLAFNLFPPSLGSAGALFVSTSTDGGVTWGTPVAARDAESNPGQSVNEFVDHQFITANPVNGHLYLTQTEFTAAGKPTILFSRSIDGNHTWSAPVAISDLAGNATFQDSFTAVGRDPSTIYVTFGAFKNAGLSNWNRIYLVKSTDGGLTFSSPQLLTEIEPLPNTLPNAAWRVDNNLWVAVDRATNQIYVNYSDYNAGDADIKVMRVVDRPSGFVVQGITDINAAESGSDQFFPFLTVAPGGRVDVCYQDRSYAPGNALVFTTCAFSTDGARTFTTRQVTMTGFDASNNNFIGDYNWQASTADAVVAIFVGDGFAGADSSGEEVFVSRTTP